MKLDPETERFFSALSGTLKEQGFLTNISADGCLHVTSKKGPAGQSVLCAVGQDGEVYCRTRDFQSESKRRRLEIVFEAVNKHYLPEEYLGAPGQNFDGGMTLG